MEIDSKYVFEISSDEDMGFANMKKDDDGLPVDDEDDHEWFKGVLGEVDGKKGDEGLEVEGKKGDEGLEVEGKKGDDGLGAGMLAKKLVPDNLEKLSLETPKPVPEVVNIDSDSDDNGDDEDDDDCVILDGDPEKPMLVGSGEVNSDVDIDSDDVEIVGEKGEVACRDFPHSRHLCAKFIFASTSHVEHCGQCHCYVCDTLAPCVYWGTGTSNSDHCHASDKDEYWRSQRKRSKNGDKPVPITIKTLFSRKNATAPVSGVPLPPPSSQMPSQNVVPITMQPSVASNVSEPNPIDRFRLLRRSQSMSPRLRTASNSHNSSMDMNQSTAKRSYPYFPPEAEFDRNGFAGSSSNTMNGYENSLSQCQSSHGSLKRCRTLPTSVLNGTYGLDQHNTVGSTYIQPQMSSDSSTTYTVRSSQPQIRSGPISSHPGRPFQPQSRPGSVSSCAIRPNPQIFPGPVMSTQIRNNHQNFPGSLSSTQIRSSQPQMRPGLVPSGMIRPSQPQKCPGSVPSGMIRPPQPQRRSGSFSCGMVRPSQPQMCPGSVPSSMTRPSQPQIHPGPISSSSIASQPYLSSHFVKAATAQSRVASQSNVAGSVNVIHSQTGSASQANSALPSQAFAPTLPNSSIAPTLPNSSIAAPILPNSSSTSGSQAHPKSTTSSYLYNSSGVQSSSNYSSLSIDGQSATQQGSEMHLVTNPVYMDAELEAFLNQYGPTPNASPATPLPQSAAPANCRPSSSVQKDDHVQNGASADKFLERSILSPNSSSSLSFTDCLELEKSIHETESLADIFTASPVWDEFPH